VARATASFTPALWSSTSLRGELLDLRVLRLRQGELAAVDVDVVRGQRDVGDLRIGGGARNGRGEPRQAATNAAMEP